jgi:hypothetical protein
MRMRLIASVQGAHGIASLATYVGMRAHRRNLDAGDDRDQHMRIGSKRLRSELIDYQLCLPV